jgi:hypothetical protein
VSLTTVSLLLVATTDSGFAFVGKLRAATGATDARIGIRVAREDDLI